jgi:MoaA/NifB/PqqE/SkfB family radical SAM enzyme
LSDRRADAASIEWTLGFRARAHRNRIPISATLELTSRCNLRCQHCYLGDQDEQHARREQERSTEAVKASLQEWADAGCLNLLMTGGDPMMRDDFPETYRFACELGLLVTVFCDGILVDQNIIDLFKEFPPRKVEISIYGATAETYEIVTQVPRSHAEAWEGIDLLCENGIRVGLKTVLLTLNEQELDAMEAQAKERGLPFRYDAAVFPCLPGGSNEPVDLRVSPEKVVEHDLSSPERQRQWIDKMEQTDALPMNNRLYPCGAGATGFYSDPFGNLSPCLMTTHYRVEPDDRSFQEVWTQQLGLIQKKERSGKASFLSGEMRGACVHCPAMNRLETGDEEIDSDYFIKTSALRYRAVMDLKSKNGNEHE